MKRSFLFLMRRLSGRTGRNKTPGKSELAGWRKRYEFLRAYKLRVYPKLIVQGRSYLSP